MNDYIKIAHIYNKYIINIALYIYMCVCVLYVYIMSKGLETPRVCGLTDPWLSCVVATCLTKPCRRTGANASGSSGSSGSRGATATPGESERSEAWKAINKMIDKLE